MNSLSLIGRLTRDPELRSTATTAVCKFTLAVDRESRDGGADFLPVTVFGKSAENCAKYLAKGSQAAVSGRLQSGSYQNKEGKTVYTLDVIAHRVEFLSKAGGSSKAQQQAREQAAIEEYQAQQAVQSMQMTFGHKGYEKPIDIPDGFYEMDDDENIPF